LLKEAFAFESYYREQRPRPFAYYLVYPLLFPYWLVNREARQEFLMFRGYTLASFLILYRASRDSRRKGSQPAHDQQPPAAKLE